MNVRNITKIAVVFFILGILLYDAYAYIVAGQEATVSYLIITDWSHNYPAFTLFVGIVMGHLFWALRSGPCEVCGHVQGEY